MKQKALLTLSRWRQFMKNITGANNHEQTTTNPTNPTTSATTNTSAGVGAPGGGTVKTTGASDKLAGTNTSAGASSSVGHTTANTKNVTANTGATTTGYYGSSQTSTGKSGAVGWTGSAYTPPTLTAKTGWKLPKDVTAPSNLALQIMSYRRQYRSQGIANFVETWLEPALKEVVTYLTDRGYTVAQQVVYSGEGKGFANYLFDVSKDGVLGETLFVAHYDTVDRDTGYVETRYGHGAPPAVSSATQHTRKKVSLRGDVAYIDDKLPANTGVTCLGADDGAGLAVMLHLMTSGVIGGYCFTTGEEVGGVGANTVLTHHTPYLKQYKMAVEIDRKGKTDLVYEQGVGECASKEFATWLCKELGMGHEPSDRGSYTDVATFAEVIPENVNIAAGYINAHSANEQVSLSYLDELAEKLKAVDWSKAPVKREAGDFGTPSWDYGYYNRHGSGYWGSSYSGYYSDSRIGYSTTVKGNDTGEPVPDSLAMLFSVDPDFMRHCLEIGIADVNDLDDACWEYYGTSYVEVCALYSIDTEEKLVTNN